MILALGNEDKGIGSGSDQIRPGFGTYVDGLIGIGGDKPYDWGLGVGGLLNYGCILNAEAKRSALFLAIIGISVFDLSC